MSRTWFITGSSRGFGRSLALAALRSGDRVAATARKPQQLSDVVEEFGSQVLPLALDVTDAAAAVNALHATREAFGSVDVVVNNAGYANLAPVETASEDDFRQQFETNFWGVYNVSKAAVPILRQQGGGTVVQFSSVGGRVGGTPGLGSYQAAKFGIDGLTRVLATETAPFGIRYLVVEPGGFATDWAGASMGVHGIPEEYGATAGRFDLILSTVSAPIDLSAYLGLLHAEGTMVMVGIPDEPLPLHAFSLIAGNRALAGSMIGGIAETQEMLDFCAEHGLGAEIETVAASDINDSYTRMLRSDVRYRFVLDANTI